MCPSHFLIKLSVITWAGLALNVLTGLALFSGDPVKFFYHPVFRIKILLIILGATSIWLGSAGNAGCARFTGRHAGYAHPGETDGGDFIGALVLCDYRGAAHRLCRTLKRGLSE